MLLAQKPAALIAVDVSAGDVAVFVFVGEAAYRNSKGQDIGINAFFGVCGIVVHYRQSLAVLVGNENDVPRAADAVQIFAENDNIAGKLFFSLKADRAAAEMLSFKGLGVIIGLIGEVYGKNG